MNPETSTFEHPNPTPLPQGEFEAAPSPQTLPGREELEEVYALEMNTQDIPPIRMAKDGEASDLYLLIDDDRELKRTLAQTDTIREVYIRQNRPTAWWFGIDRHLDSKTQDTLQPHDTQITAKHTAEVVVNGEAQEGQSFEVFEMGEGSVDTQSLETVFSTLRYLDQFSGGLLSSALNRPKIVLGNGFDFKKNNGGDEFKGYANDSYVFLNMTAIAESAEKAGVDPQEILAVVLTHELLGHGLETLVTKKGHGAHFKDHFMYSEQRTSGEHFDEVHESITPKDPANADSQPVREYGSLSAAEDVATSVDATISEAFGYDKSAEKIATLKSRPDAYRKELVMELMSKAAEQAAQYKNTPGFVGSELRYIRDKNGELQVKPAREFEITTIPGEAAVREEVAKVLEKAKFPREIVVSAEYNTGI